MIKNAPTVKSNRLKPVENLWDVIVRDVVLLLILLQNG